MLKEFFKRYKWFLEHYKKEYILGFVFLGISYIIMIFPPRILGATADLIIEGKINPESLLRNVLLIVGLAILSYAVEYIWSVKIYRASDEIDRLARMRILSRILKQGPRFFSRNSAGSIMGKATNDVEALTDSGSYGAMLLFDATLMPLMVIGFMFNISWKVTLFSLIPYPLLIIFSRVVGKKLYEYYSDAQRAFDEMNQSVLEAVSGIRVVRAYNLEEAETKKFTDKADNLFKKNMRAVFYSQMYMPVINLVPALAFVLAMGVGYTEIQNGNLTSGNLLSFSLYLNMLSWPMIAIGEFLLIAQEGNASMKRIDDLLEEPLDVEDREDTLDFPAKLNIEVKDLHFTYPDAKEAESSLRGINFQLKEGQTLGIVGPVGCGKTSLLRQFLHFYPLQEGQIFFDGKDLALIDRKSLKQNLSYVPQQSFLFSQNIRENILLGASDDLLNDKEKAEIKLDEVIRLADFKKDLKQFKEGLDTQVGEKGIALSGGQKQRICIARALIKDAQLLILDDCLSAVDAITEQQILKSLKKETTERTVLISAHRLSAVKDADLILVMDQGKIVERGTHEELMANDKWYATQFRKQQLDLQEESTHSA